VSLGAFTSIGDSNDYIITISARYVGATTWLTTTTATVSYVHPCSQATITANAFPPITTSLFVPVTSLVGIWYDSFTGSSSATKKCGDFHVEVTKTVFPASYIEATMGADFSLITSSLNSILTVNPQNVLVGDYVLTVHISLTNYP
jgi:hypothetical protein